MGQCCSGEQDIIQQNNQQVLSEYYSQLLSELSEEPLQQEAIIQKIISHIQHRFKIKQMYKEKGIQILDKPEQLISDIQEPQLDPTQSLVYKTIQKELSEKGFVDFRYLGQGKQGLVFLTKELSTNRRYAIKGLHVKDSQGNIFQETFDQAQKEIQMLEKCQGSSYVVNLLNQIEGKEFMYLALSECQGTLSEIIEMSPNKKLNELSAIKYAKDIAEGLLHIHSQKCIANDLKMDNILIDYNGNAVVSDLGLADNLTKTSGYGMNQYMGNLLFQAPECYDPTKFKDYSDEYKKLGLNISTKPTAKSEAFSLGFLIYLMIQDFKSTLIFNKHKPLEYSSEFNKFKYHTLLKYIIDGLTQFKPEDRLSIKDVLIILKGIISFEFQLEFTFSEVLEGKQTQEFIREFKNDIEFVQNSSNRFYPIIKNEQVLLQELLIKQQKEQEAKFAQQNQQNLLSESQLEAQRKLEKKKKDEEALRKQQKKQELEQQKTQKKNRKGYLIWQEKYCPHEVFDEQQLNKLEQNLFIYLVSYLCKKQANQLNESMDERRKNILQTNSQLLNEIQAKEMHVNILSKLSQEIGQINFQLEKADCKQR